MVEIGLPELNIKMQTGEVPVVNIKAIYIHIYTQGRIVKRQQTRIRVGELIYYIFIP